MSASQPKAKSLFKKPKKRRIMKKRKIDDDEKEVEVEPSAVEGGSTVENADTDSKQQQQFNMKDRGDESESVLSKIHSLKKAKKLKNFQRAQTYAMKQKVKNGSSKTGTGGESDEEEQRILEANKDLKQRLEGTFGSSKGGNSMDDDGNILTKKHKVAMEQYINSQMEDTLPDTNSNTNTNTDANSQRQKTVTFTEHVEIKDTTALYAQILEESNQIARNETDATEEGDMGAGGAVLGGTGIAEVTLSVEDRINAAKETELAAARLYKKKSRSGDGHSNGNGNGNGNGDGDESSSALYSRKSARNQEDLSTMLPMSFGAGPSKRRSVQTTGTSSNMKDESSKVSAAKKIDALSKTVTTVGSSYAHNFHMHNKEWISNQKKMEEENRPVEKDDEDGVDSSRLGFEAKRELSKGNSNFGNGAGGGSGAGSGPGGGKTQTARDDRTFKKFVRREMGNRNKR